MAETVTRSLPAQFIEDLGKDYAKQLTATTAIPVDTSKFAPTVAAQDALQTQAATLAGTGVGSFQPFITAAQQAAADAGTTIGGISSLTGAPTAAQTAAFTSPFQQQVIDTTLAEFDRQKAINEQNIRDQQAQAARQQDIQNRFGLAQAQSGLGQFQTGLAQQVPALQRADVSTLGQVGAAQQAQRQAVLDAQRQGARTAAYEPLERLGFFGQGVTGLMGGYPAQYQFTQTPPASPLQTALGLGTGLAGIFGALK